MKDNKKTFSITDIISKNRIRRLSHIKDFHIDFKKNCSELFKSQPSVDMIMGPDLTLISPKWLEDVAGGRMPESPFMGDISDFWRMMQGSD